MTLPSLEILYEDNHQIVVNKPAGVLTQPDDTDNESLEELVKTWIKIKYNKQGNVFIGTVHRIDKPVSGVVLFARTSKALSRLNDSMRQKHTHKMYLATVEGHVANLEGTLEHYLVHDDYHARVTHPKDPSGKLCRLHYRLIEQKENNALVEVVLETGRYHQIRAQMSAIGHPIVGDRKYGSRQQYQEGAIALQHYRLQIPHPITGELQTFEAPLSQQHKKAFLVTYDRE